MKKKLHKAQIGDGFYETGVHQINGDWVHVQVLDQFNFICKPAAAPETLDSESHNEQSKPEKKRRGRPPKVTDGDS